MGQHAEMLRWFWLGAWDRILVIGVDEVISETHASPSGLSIMIENNLVLRNTQLLKDCLLLCPGSTHDHTTFTTVVLSGYYSLPACPSHECALK